MDRRQSLIAVLITIGALILLALITLIFNVRGNSPEPPSQYQAAAPHEGFSDTGTAAPELEPYLILTGCQLVETRTNRGSLIRIRHEDKEFTLRLYYAEAPWLQVTDSATSDNQGAIPNLVGNQLVSISETSAKFTLGKLRDNTFKVFTRWEKAENNDTFYGWILLRPGGNDPRYLSELLVANGFASILRSHAEPPAGNLDHTGFLQRLNSLQQIARSKRLGAFANDSGA